MKFMHDNYNIQYLSGWLAQHSEHQCAVCSSAFSFRGRVLPSRTSEGYHPFSFSVYVYQSLFFFGLVREECTRELLIVLINLVICHATILLKILNNCQIGGRFKKRNRAIKYFSFILRASLCKIFISSFAHIMDFAHNFSVDFF